MCDCDVKWSSSRQLSEEVEQKIKRFSLLHKRRKNRDSKVDPSILTIRHTMKSFECGLCGVTPDQ
jgi:hypothetical protein